MDSLRSRMIRRERTDRTPLQQRMRDELASDVNYYRRDPEGRRAGGPSTRIQSRCQYNLMNDDGSLSHCAIGRRFKPTYKAQGEELPGNTRDIFRVAYDNDWKNLDNMFEAKHRGLPMEFWLSLQVLHDCDEHWADGTRPNRPCGLTDFGLKYVRKLTQRITNGYYTNGYYSGCDILDSVNHP